MHRFSKVQPTQEHLDVANEEANLCRCFVIKSSESIPPHHPDKLRALQIIQNPHVGLYPVFSSTGEPLLKIERPTFEEKQIPTILAHHRIDLDEKEGQPATLDQPQFEKNFIKLTHRLLEGIDWSHIFIAGGSVLECLTSDSDLPSHSDVDIFIHDSDENNASVILKHVIDIITKNIKKQPLDDPRFQKVELFKTRRSILVRTCYRDFQIITTLYHSPAEVILGFDVDCCSVGTQDGKTVLATKQALRSLKKRYNLWQWDLKKMFIYDGRYQKRLSKYSKRGYAVLVPNVDWNLIDPEVFKTPIKYLKGVPLLVMLDRIATMYPKKEEHRHFFTTGIEECIHGGESWCQNCNLKKSEKPKPADPAEPQSFYDRLDISAPAEWARNRIVYQDFDTFGQTRLFDPILVPLNYEEGVYISSNDNVNTDDSNLQADQSEMLQESQDHQATATLSIENGDNTQLDSANQTGVMRLPLSSTDGIQVPTCYCNVSCAIKRVTKSGKNHARRFFCCILSTTKDSCNYFQWADSDLPYDQARALRLKKVVPTEHVPEVIKSLEVETSKLLYAITSCYKSGRLSSEEKNGIKDLILSKSDELRLSELSKCISEFESHQDIDVLSQKLKKVYSMN